MRSNCCVCYKLAHVILIVIVVRKFASKNRILTVIKDTANVDNRCINLPLKSIITPSIKCHRCLDLSEISIPIPQRTPPPKNGEEGSFQSDHPTRLVVVYGRECLGGGLLLRQLFGIWTMGSSSMGTDRGRRMNIMQLFYLCKDSYIF